MTARRTFTARVSVGAFTGSGSRVLPWFAEHHTLSFSFHSSGLVPSFASSSSVSFSNVGVPQGFILCPSSSHPCQSPRGSHPVLGTCVHLSAPAFVLSSNLRLALQAAVPATWPSHSHLKRSLQPRPSLAPSALLLFFSVCSAILHSSFFSPSPFCYQSVT